MPNNPRVVILGGGTAGWMTAAALGKLLGSGLDSVTLVESDQIGTVGVGEATIPHIRFFNERLGINEHEFIKQTQATYKLGIEFANWGKLNESYIHPFGDFGTRVKDTHFHHHWVRAKQSGYQHSLFDFSLPVVAAQNNRFSYPSSNAKSLLSTFAYAFHIDATLYARYLRELCEQQNLVSRIEGRVKNVVQGDNGDIKQLNLENGKTVEGDIFIDCSGFRALLIEKTLNCEFEDWSHWLACDRAIAIPTEKASGPTRPYTIATAHSAGWQWRIPLQHRTGNGHVYCSEYMSDDEAAHILLSNLDAPTLADPNYIKFKAGRRETTWKNNCVAIGLSSGFLEPLESTSIYLIQAAIMKLVDLFPTDQNYDQQRNEYNRQIALEYDRVKDFLILHYHATGRDDSEFWRYCKNMDIPDSLSIRMQAFRDSGYVDHYDQGLFLVPSWIAVMMGQGIIPQSYHPSADALNIDKLTKSLDHLRSDVSKHVDQMLIHDEALEDHITTEAPWPEARLSLYGVFS